MLNISTDPTQSPCRSTAILPNVVTESLKTNVRVCHVWVVCRVKAFVKRGWFGGKSMKYSGMKGSKSAKSTPDQTE